MSDASNEALRLAAEAEEAPEVPQQPDESEAHGVTFGWRIGGAAEADWALQRIAEAQKEMAEADEMEAKAIQRIREKAAQLRKGPQRTVDFFTGHLRMWAEANPEAIRSGKKKSRAFIHGRVGWRKRPERLVVKDAATALAWVRQQVDVDARLFIREEPVRDAFATYFNNTGVEPDGCAVEGGDETFQVTAEAEE